MAGGCGYAQSIAITSPTAAQALSGWAGAGSLTPFTFAVALTSAPNTTRVCYAIDGYSVYNPGWGAPYTATESALYANGCSITAPYSMPYNTYWTADGAHTVVATAYDVNGGIVETSLAVAFTVVNTWPVQCTDLSAPASSLTLGSVTGGIAQATWTVTGSCATDTKTFTVFVDGVAGQVTGSYLSTPTLATLTAGIDETPWLNGVHKICWAWADTQSGNYAVYDGPTNVQAAGEQCVPANFSNGALPSQVWDGCNDCFLTPSATVTLTPKLIRTDSSTATGITFDYVSLNTAIATVNTSGVVTAASACPTAGSPCSAQILTMGESQAVGCTDLHTQFSTFQFWSSCYTFLGSDKGKLIRVISGTNWTPGVYQITNVDERAQVISITPNPATSVSASGGSFILGPTRTSNILVWPSNTLPCFGSDGVIYTTNPGNCVYMHEGFASSGTVTANSEPAYSYAGGNANGPFAEFDAGGFNTFEISVIPAAVTCDGYGSTTLQQFQTSMTNYLAAFAPALASARNAKYLYATGDNVMGAANFLWMCAFGTPSAWSTPIMAAALNAISNSGFTMFGVNMKDEVGTSWSSKPLAGPITPSGSNSWLTSITSAGGGTCQANGSGFALNGSRVFIIHGSSTTSLNTALGGAGYLASNGNAGFTFPCTAPTGTYTDAGLTLEPYAADGYTDNSNTSYIGYDAFANLRLQANQQTGHIPITAAAATVNGCITVAGWGGLSTNGPIHGIAQFGQYSDFYPDDSQVQTFLVSRNSNYWNATGSSGPGAYTRASYGCYSPVLPLVTLVSADESLAGLQGYTAAISSISGSTMTFTSGHNLLNVVPGDTRVTVSGNSTTALNATYFVLGILSPTQLRVALSTSDFTGNCTNATITFSPSGYSPPTPTGIDTSCPAGGGICAYGALQQFKFSNGTNQQGTAFGQAFFLGAANLNLAKHNGENFTVSGCSTGTNAAAFNTPTFVLAPTNLPTPSWNASSGGTNIYWELPSGSGTGGTAIIQPDNASTCGRTGCLRPNENDPTWSFGNYMETAITGAAGMRSYKLEGPQFAYQPGWGYTGFGQYNSTIFASGPNLSPFRNYTGLTNQFYVYPHWENSGSVPIFHALSTAAMSLTRWQNYMLQTRLNSPDYGFAIDCTARTGSKGKVLLCVNITNGVETRMFNLTPYLQGGQKIIQNVVGPDGTNVITSIAAGTGSQSVTLADGQTVYFVFPVNYAAELNQPTITARLVDVPNAAGVTVRWGYDLYLFDVPLQNAFNCGATLPCTIPADLNYGIGYYTINYTNVSGAVIATSGVQSFTPTSDLTVSLSCTGVFAQGDPADTYTITVSNNSGGPTVGTVTVVDTLPSGLTLSAMAGVGWACIAIPGTCTRTDALAPGLSYPPIILTVSVATNAASSVTNTVVVSGGGEINTTNDSATDNTPVIVTAVTFVTSDNSTMGNWKGVYGQDGALIPNNVNNPPSYGIVSTVTASTFTWAATTTNVLALLKADPATDRIASAYYPTSPGTSFTFNIQFTDTALHQVATYFLDWDSLSRAETVTLTKTVTGATLDTRTVSAFTGGTWLVWNVSGNVQLTITPISGGFVVLNGLFFGAITPPAPNVNVTKTHTGNFTQGQTGATFTITGSNLGTGPTSGTVTITDTIPTGLTATSIAGTGWACTQPSGPCTRSDVLAASASYPALTLTVNVSGTAPSSVTNTVIISGGGSVGSTTANDTAAVGAVPDLTITKTHSGNFSQSQTGATFAITATNSGAGSTSGTVTVTDTVPSGLTPTTAAGTGWSCGLASQVMTCTRSDVLAASASYPAITLTVNVAANAASSILNTAAVSGGGELITSNNSATDTVTVIGSGFTLLTHNLWSLGASGGTTPALNTTGAALITAQVYYATGTTFVSSPSNTWTVNGTPACSSAGFCVASFYAITPTTSAAMTFTATGTIVSVSVQAFADSSGTPALDGTPASASGTGSTVSVGPTTPTVNGDIVIAALAGENLTSVAVAAPFSGLLDFIPKVGGVNELSTVAYFTQATAASVTAAWNWQNSGHVAGQLYAFSPTGGGGGTGGTTSSVSDYGATGNGVTDDTRSEQNAVNACAVGGTLIWPAGTYLTTSPVTLKNNCTYQAKAGAVTTGTALINSTALTVASGTGISSSPPQTVVGVGIMPGTIVTAVSGTAVTLSLPTTVAMSGTPVTFYAPVTISGYTGAASGAGYPTLLAADGSSNITIAGMTFTGSGVAFGKQDGNQSPANNIKIVGSTFEHIHTTPAWGIAGWYGFTNSVVDRNFCLDILENGEPDRAATVNDYLGSACLGAYYLYAFSFTNNVVDTVTEGFKVLQTGNCPAPIGTVPPCIGATSITNYLLHNAFVRVHRMGIETQGGPPPMGMTYTSYQMSFNTFTQFQNVYYDSYAISMPVGWVALPFTAQNSLVSHNFAQISNPLATQTRGAGYCNEIWGVNTTFDSNICENFNAGTFPGFANGLTIGGPGMIVTNNTLCGAFHSSYGSGTIGFDGGCNGTGAGSNCPIATNTGNSLPASCAGVTQPPGLGPQ